MPSATPSEARVANAVRAVVAAGLAVRAVVVAADGSFRVETEVPKTPQPAQGPPRWGE